MCIRDRKLGNQNIFILCWTFLVAVTISCNSQSQSNKENQIVHSKDNSTRLKYTTGVRSILEDSKGNTWFGSYNEGVSLLHNGKFQYFTTENGLSNNQVRNIYEDGNGIIWFECGRGLSTYNAVSYTHLRAHETVLDLVCRLLLDKKQKQSTQKQY